MCIAHFVVHYMVSENMFLLTVIYYVRFCKVKLFVRGDLYYVGCDKQTQVFA